jgi:hypothetical protein
LRVLGIHPAVGEFALNGQNIFFSFNYTRLKLDFDAPTRAGALFSGPVAGSQLTVVPARSRISAGKGKSALTADSLA